MFKLFKSFYYHYLTFLILKKTISLVFTFRIINRIINRNRNYSQNLNINFNISKFRYIIIISKINLSLL